MNEAKHWMRDRWLLAALVIAIVAFGIRLHRIADWSLGNDEIAEVRWSSGTFAEMIEELRRDKVHPPLDYFIQFVFGKLGVPEWIRRLPSVMAGSITVFLIFLLARWWVSPAAGVVAALLLTFATNHVRYSQEVRPYALAFFFATFSLVALEMHARSGRRGWAVGWAVGWGAAVWLAGATLYFGGVVAAIGGFTRIILDRKSSLATLWRALPTVILIWIAFYFPWLPVVFSAADGHSPAPPETLDWKWWEHRLQVFGTGDWKHEPVSAGSWAFWASVVIGIGASLRFRLLRTVTAWFLIGAALTVLFLQLRPHYPVPRYLMPAWIAAFPLAGAGVAILFRNRVTMIAGAALLAMTIAFQLPTLVSYFRGQRPEWRAVAEHVHGRARSGQTVVATNPWVVRNFGWYWRQRPVPQGVIVERFERGNTELRGPAWIVTGGCFPREILKSGTTLDRSWPLTELAEVRFLCDGCTLSRREEWCPE